MSDQVPDLAAALEQYQRNLSAAELARYQRNFAVNGGTAMAAVLEQYKRNLGGNLSAAAASALAQYQRNFAVNGGTAMAAALEQYQRKIEVHGGTAMAAALEQYKRNLGGNLSAAAASALEQYKRNLGGNLSAAAASALAQYQRNVSAAELSQYQRKIDDARHERTSDLSGAIRRATTGTSALSTTGNHLADADQAEEDLSNLGWFVIQACAAVRAFSPSAELTERIAAAVSVFVVLTVGTAVMNEANPEAFESFNKLVSTPLGLLGIVLAVVLSGQNRE